jgi:16S rRNA (cytosine1402-N4)-methyltransferase
MALIHTTVLLQQAVQALLEPAETAPAGASLDARRFVDATFGRGGHTGLLLSKLGPQDRVTVFDKDPQAIAVAQQLAEPRLEVRHQGFAHLGELPPASVDGVLMDLGVSSPQIDDPARGFSFRFDGPLDMRMDTTRGESVAEWLAHAELGQIAEVIRDYGEERFAGPIAKAIVARRQERGPLSGTAELAQLVAGAVKTREPGQNPATRTFQALRIFINAELEELQQGLSAALQVLKPGGRLVVISFHSLEDRIVKNFIAQHAREVFDRRAPFAQPKPLALLAGARVKPGADEVAANPRARSAIMRVAYRSDLPFAEIAQAAAADSRKGRR